MLERMYHELITLHESRFFINSSSIALLSFPFMLHFSYLDDISLMLTFRVFDRDFLFLFNSVVVLPVLKDHRVLGLTT